ncbi:MAG: PepSY-associated TM helix domain-containing protein, partial [Rhodoferax sp.]
MTTTSESPAPTSAPAKPSPLYFQAWRWHFFSGLYVVPFLLMLAVTGLVMVYFTGFQDRLGQKVPVVPQANVAAITDQVKTVLAQYPKAAVKEYVTPKAPDLSAWVVVQNEGATLSVAVDPYRAEIIKSVDKENTVYAWAEKIHGTLLIGDAGDRLIEISAGLGIVQIITGLYLFWPRNGGTWAQALIPDFSASGRKLWKSLHTSVGFWVSLILLAFLLTGLSWTGIWGGKFVQPWNSFPAEKWDAPKSDLTHASLNPDGLHEVPWGLEKTPLPASGSDSGKQGIPAGQPVNLDSL